MEACGVHQETRDIDSVRVALHEDLLRLLKPMGESVADRVIAVAVEAR